MPVSVGSRPTSSVTGVCSVILSVIKSPTIGGPVGTIPFLGTLSVLLVWFGSPVFYG